ncbi:MAG: hypothetical protein KF869_12875 [Phycisphaeraceae bacterium]|nr:hypothetical protein [Phycisphaeraceae bacterium]
MTRQATIADSGPARQVAGACGVRGVRWRISPDALRAYAPAIVNGRSAELTAAELFIDLDPPRAVLVLISARGDRAEHALPLAAAAPEIVRDEPRGLLHIDLPGVLAMCLRANGDRRAALVYAHTPLLAAIGLPGGVYDVPVLVENGVD